MEPETNSTEELQKPKIVVSANPLKRKRDLKKVEVSEQKEKQPEQPKVSDQTEPEKSASPVQTNTETQKTEASDQTQPPKQPEQTEISNQAEKKEISDQTEPEEEQSENPESSDSTDDDSGQKELCPPYCPFLQADSSFCRLFSCQLLASPPFVFKCKECMDSDARKSAYKAKVKDFEKRVYMWDKAAKSKPFDLWGKFKTRVADWKERKVFKEFLMTLAGKLPILLDTKMSKLLMDLYLILNSSERMVMKNLLSNPKAAELLIKKIKEIGKTPNLLKLVCKEMDNMAAKQKKENKEMEKMQKIKQNNLQRQ